MNKLLKNVDYEPQDLVGEVVKITNNHMEFLPSSLNSYPDYHTYKGTDFVGLKTKWAQGAGFYHYLNVGTKWLILKVRGSNDDEVLVANFTDPLTNLWIPLDELERSARLVG
jgi:hypothetical protein